MFTFSFRAMGSQFLIAMDSEEDPWTDLGEKVTDQIEEWEQCLSRFRTTSELSKLNQATGSWQQVSETFWQVLNLSIEQEKKTSGIVTPSVLNALEGAGYKTSFDGMADNIEAILRQPLTSSGHVREIELQETTHSVKIPVGLRLDFGGVAKGWAVRQMMRNLKKYAPVLVDGGGDIATSGPLRDGSGWPVAVADPIDPDQNLGMIMLNGDAVATSGRDYRRWKLNGQWQHHLIDPRIDRPAQTDILSTTVIAKDVTEAEAQSKMALILGSQEALQSLKNEDRVAFLIVLEDGSSITSTSFEEHRWNEKWMLMKNNLLA